MATRHSARDRHAAPGPSQAPVLIVLVAVASVVLFIALSNEPDKAEASPAPSGAPAEGGADPFADMDPIEPPRPRSIPSAPAGIADNPLNVRANALAKEGLALIDAAFEARDSGDHSLFLERATAGRQKLSEAKSMTSEWLMDLQEKYPNDPQLRRIERHRRPWNRALKRVKYLR